MNKIPRVKAWVRILLSLITPCLLLFFTEANAANPFSGGPSLGTAASNITGNFADVARLITAASYIAGLGFALSSLLKFKQHKDNPQQIPIGTPIALLFIGAALVFLPTIIGVANQTLFSGSGSGSVGGVTS